MSGAEFEFDHDRWETDASYRDGYTALHNEICLEVPESWDDDGFNVVDYVREIERRLVARGGSLERWEPSPGGGAAREAPPNDLGSWRVRHPGLGVLTYPDESTARSAAGTAGVVYPPGESHKEHP